MKHDTPTNADEPLQPVSPFARNFQFRMARRFASELIRDLRCAPAIPARQNKVVFHQNLSSNRDAWGEYCCGLSVELFRSLQK